MTRTITIREADTTQPTGRIADLTETNINQIFGAIDRRIIGAPITAEPIAPAAIIDRPPIDAPTITPARASISSNIGAGPIGEIAQPTIISPIGEIIRAWRRAIISAIFGDRAIGIPG